MTTGETITAIHYDARTRAYHWTSAVLVIVLWVMGRTTGLLPRGPFRVDVWSVHVLLGFGLAAVFALRLVWRFGSKRQGPLPERGLLRKIASIVHSGLYGLLAAVVMLGIVNAFARGFPMFNLVKLPEIGLGALKHDVNSWHDLAANILAGIVGLHAVAALYHHLVLRDQTLMAMLPHRSDISNL
ncbi:MAG: cytochrome b [Asticcacaulis sp.]|uniref:cytochrome b n=1 Tax=Asticcacaulis sp. TaxID=1872648 RepID=UPI003F7BBAF4